MRRGNSKASWLLCGPNDCHRKFIADRIGTHIRYDAFHGPRFFSFPYYFSILNSFDVHSSWQKLEKMTCFINVKNTFPRELFQFLFYLQDSTEYRSRIYTPCFHRRRNQTKAKTFCKIIHPPLRSRYRFVFFVAFGFQKFFAGKYHPLGDGSPSDRNFRDCAFDSN